MIKNSIFVVTTLIFCVIAQFSLSMEVDWFQYSRDEIAAGQWWRFITASFVHLGWPHFAMNAFALVIMYLYFAEVVKLKYWFLIFLLCCLAVTLGLWIFNPKIYWYVGLSGALHGLVLALLLLDLGKNKSLLSIGLLFVILAKLLWEILFGPLPLSEMTAGGPVLVQAHLYGAAAGVLISAWMNARKIYIK